MKYKMTAIIEKEGDGYTALCPEIDIASQGDTVEQARDNLKEALELFFETASPEEVNRRLIVTDKGSGLDKRHSRTMVNLLCRMYSHSRGKKHPLKDFNNDLKERTSPSSRPSPDISCQNLTCAFT